MVEIEITGTVITAQFGALKTGDILRCDKAFADHMVNDARAAKYIVKKEPETVEKLESVEDSKVAKKKAK